MKAIRTKLKLATALTSMALVNGGIGDVFGQSVPRVSTYAAGLTNPRGLTFGPDGSLYVAEAGTGGGQTPADIDPSCPVNVNVFSPYTAGYSGRVTRVLADGTKETVADNLPTMTDITAVSLRAPDVAFVDGTLYVLIEMGGCSHALPEDLPAILRVNPDGSTTNVANLNAWLAANPSHFIKDTNPATTDLEPDGVFHSMFAAGRYLYVVETNRGMLLRVDPRKGVIELAYDMSIDNAEHNPIVLTRHGNEYYIGTFGDEGEQAELGAVRQEFLGLFAAVRLAQSARRLGLAPQPAVRRRDLPRRRAVDHRQCESRRLRSRDRRTHRGAQRLREPAQRADRRS